ncbi:MAG: phytanoyl-CoA dioxygenase family protein [Pyrinomonadaceae bacterium]
MRRIFKDEGYERLFERDGCVLLKALDDAAVARIEEFYLANVGQDFSGVQSTIELSSAEQKAKIHNFLAQIFDEYLSVYFENYKALAGNFSSKKPGPHGRVHAHRDWPLVNETEYTALNLWTPLCETDADNGALGVFKGSHRLRSTIHSTNLPSTVKLSERSLRYITFFHMKPGEVLVFDTRTIHASGPNNTARQRNALSVGIIPAEARPIHYVGDRLKPSSVSELEVDEDFYHNYHLERGRYISPSDDHVVNTGGYRRREVEFTPAGIDDRDILGLYEPRAVTALRRIKDRLTAKVASR